MQIAWSTLAGACSGDKMLCKRLQDAGANCVWCYQRNVELMVQKWLELECGEVKFDPEVDRKAE